MSYDQQPPTQELSQDRQTMYDELLMDRQATYEQYVGMPSLLSPLEVGALPLERCVQYAGPITSEQQAGSAACVLELAQVYTMTNRPKEAQEAAAFAKRIASSGRNVLELHNKRHGADYYDPYFLDTLYRFDAFIAQYPTHLMEGFGSQMAYVLGLMSGFLPRCRHLLSLCSKTAGLRDRCSMIEMSLGGARRPRWCNRRLIRSTNSKARSLWCSLQTLR